MATDFVPGDRAYLTPHTPQAPGICYQQVEVRIVAVSLPYHKVRVAQQGHERFDEVIDIVPANLRKTRPGSRTSEGSRTSGRSTRKVRTPTLDLGPNEAEVTLF